MTKPRGNMGGQIKPVKLQRRLRLMKGGDRQHIVGIAMDEQHRRLGPEVCSQPRRISQHAGISDDASELTFAARTDMECHHRSLAEADECESNFGKAIARKLVCDEIV